MQIFGITLARSALLFTGIAVPFVTSCSSAASSSGEDSAEAAAAGSSGSALARHTANGCDLGGMVNVIEFAGSGASTSCAAVAGNGGVWTVQGDAPIPVCTDTSGTSRGVPYLCTYSWQASPKTPTAQPDQGALVALPGVYVAAATTLNCGDTTVPPTVAMEEQAQVQCPGRGHNGPRECDVCAASARPGVSGHTLFLSKTATTNTVVVGLTNGSMATVVVGSTAADWGSYLAMPLPALPKGVQYTRGPALGYGYNPPVK